MTNMITKQNGRAMGLVMLLILAAGFVMAQLNQPLSPTSATFVQNYTRTNFSGYGINDSRAHIWVYNFNQIQISTRWKGYVGNITGSFALSDPSNNRLYSWTITTTTGEVIATKWDPSSGTQGVPRWSTLGCANPGNRTGEALYFAHTTYDEDSYGNTWLNGTTSAFNHSAIVIAETTIQANTCFGVNLYASNAVSVGNTWVEVVLQDNQCDTTVSNNCNVVYAAMIANNSVGFNGATFDYQLLLPEKNQNGTTPNTKYWFYVELI